MPVKDRVVTWWIQNIVTPKREIIDKPGFVITTFTEKDQMTYLREIFFAEELFELIENKIVQKYGNQGKQTLYSAGKKNGYLYASISNFPDIKENSKKTVSDFAYLFVRYCEGVFAQKAKHEIDIDKKIFSMALDEYIVCRHNGHGYIMNDGGSAGIWAYLMQDKSIEGIQLECQGRGDEKCLVICAPKEELLTQKDKIFYENNLTDQKFDEIYQIRNEIREDTYAQLSLKDMIDAGFFDYKKGILSYKNSRFFGSESHIFYILEQEISKLDDGEQTLFDICVEYGKSLRQLYGERDYQKFIMDFFSALGFGDITFLDSNTLVASYYPWTIFSEKSKYIIFRGVLSGIVSDSLEKKVEFNEYKIDVEDFLTLTIKQNKQQKINRNIQ
jgi:hypothetical protein